MKTNWTNLELWDSDGNLITDDDDRRKLLREYRDTGGIWQHWLVDPADYTEETCEEMAYAGPAVEEIDWSGIDA